MNRFFSTCAAGLEQVAARIAKERLRGFEAEQILTGAVLYTAQEDRPVLSVFQNTYLVLNVRRSADPMERAAALLSRDRASLNAAQNAVRLYGFGTFRYMFSDQNRLCSVNPGTRGQLENAIRTARPDRVTPQTELLILRRSEGLILFLLRLTKRDGTEKTLAKGELSPAVASCMAHLACPRAEGVFLDPFAGHGATGQARLAIGPVKRMLLFDTDPEMLSGMRTKQALKKPFVSIAQHDAFMLSEFLPRGSVTELAADPPWGLFTPLPVPAEEFYRDMLREFAFVLAQGGHVCVLTADKPAMEQAIAAQAELRFGSRIDILVNGKKAALYPGVRL